MQVHPELNENNKNISKLTALRFIILIGIVSLFADITYQGANSIKGPFLSILGANATTVGIVAGFGELVGYCLRLVSGYISDRTRKYWLITFIGYTLNMVAVPALTALFFGYLYDRKGISILIITILIATPFAPLVFLGGFYTALTGMILWGIGMGAQDPS